MQTGHMGHREAAQDNVLADLLIGAVAGAAAVWVMDRVDWFNYRHEDSQARQRTQDVRPGGMAPAQVAVGKMADAADVELSPGKHHALGKAVHYSLGTAPGAVYGALRERYPAISKGRGLLFGFGLFLVQDEGLNALLGLSAKPKAYPWQAHARGLVAHLVYGVATDTFFTAMKRRLSSSRSLQQDSRSEVDVSAARVDVTETRLDNDTEDFALRGAAAYGVRETQGIDQASTRAP
jgi:uncharacterized membrane protein YagU involved in acid resistance